MDWNRFNELNVAINSGQIQSSLTELATMADAEPLPSDKVAILVAMSHAYRTLKRFQESRSALHEARGILGTESQFYPRLMLALAVLEIDEQNWQGALKMLDAVSENYGSVLRTEDNIDAWQEVQRNRGLALFELNRVSEALPLLQSVRSVEYQRERTLYSIAASHIQLKDFDAAILDFGELLSLNPGSIYSSYAHYNLGRIYYGRMQLARAKNEFEKCLACPDRGNLSDEEIFQALVYTCEGLNLEKDTVRYNAMLRSARK
jgi:tetratricopeptide (TPR) repeat protein